MYVCSIYEYLFDFINLLEVAMDKNMRVQKFIDFIAEELFLEHKSAYEPFLIMSRDDMIPSVLDNALAICRRAFKASDVRMLVVLDENHEGEKGIAFTEKKLYVWNGEDEERIEVTYGEVDNLDYGEDCIMIACGEKDYSIEVDGDDPDINYPRKLYNLVADELERIEDENKTPLS